MGIEENREIAHRYFLELLSEPSDPSLIEEIMDPDVTFWGPITEKGLHGREHYRSFLEAWVVGFPDRKFTPGQTVAEGNRVAMRFKIEAHHRGVFMGAEPTGRRIEVHGINLFHFKNGKLNEVHAFFNPHDLLGPIGLESAVEIPHPKE